QVRMSFGVEEVRRLEVRAQVLVLDVDARDLRAALEPRPVAVHDQLRPDVVELALERAGHVGDLEVDRGVDGIERPGAGECLCRGGAHFVYVPHSVVYYLSAQLI